MANIKKSFNFRNGVQVDDDNLKVSATGLVGIGTTVPTEALDVRGNLVVSGVSSAVTLQAGVATITTLNPTEIIGAGVSIKSGIVTASSGIITYFGDGINLLNLPTSQWEDTIVGAGVSSIYNTGGNVGIATTAAIFTLQVGNDVNSGQKGVGISSFGDIKASGIVTATGFVGNLTGDVTGNFTGNVTGVAASTSQLQTARLIGGVSFDGTSDINLPGVNIAGNQNTSGTAANLSGTPSVVVNDLSVSGISTFSDDVFFTGASYNAKWDKSQNRLQFLDRAKLSLGSSPEYEMYHKPDTNDIRVEVQSGTNYILLSDVFDIKNSAGTRDLITAFGNNGNDNYVQLLHNDVPRLRTNGIGVTVFNQLDTINIVASGVITATTELNTQLLGVGTNVPAHDIQVRKSGDTEIQVTSDTGSAGITVGREAGQGKTNNAEFRYGFSAGSDYNTPQSLDIINYGTDNFNYYLSANNPGAVTGNYFWHKGLNNVRLMTLTNTGRLGIGVTEPTDELDVQGGVTVSGNVAVGNNITVSGTVIGNLQGTVTGNVAGTLAGNTNTTVGISTLNNLSVAGIATAVRLRANNFAIGQDPNTELLSIFVSNANKIIVNDVGQIGISTTTVLPGVTVSASTANMSISQIGVGVTQFNSGSVDFSTAGGPTLAARRYMVPPKVDTSTRNSFTGLVAGSLVYNTSTNTLQLYNGSSWGTLGSGGGGGEVNQNAFSTIAVSGQSNVSADSTTDTLTLVAGSNVTITTDAGSDSVTINASGGGGGSSTFTGLSDTPGSLTARKYLRVNSAGNALELKNSGLGDGFVNAVDYGLDASATDGTNVTAINNAIAALGTNGGTIFFPGGMFYLNAAIELTQAANENSLRFVGSGHQNYGGGSDAGGTVLRRDADDEFFNITNSRAIHFVGITFKGGAANGNGGNSGISGGNGAIYVLANAGCQGYLIENCVFHGIANCITFKGLSDSIIRGCRFRNVPSNEGNGACIKLDENGSEVIDQIRIQDCVIDGSPDGSAINTAIDGIAIYNTVSTVYVTNTSAIRLRRSFYSDSTWDGNFFYFQNSEAERANEDGFSINGTGNFVTIDNCFSSTNNGHGINIGSSQNSSLNITNPNVRDNSGHGILIDGPTNNCSIVNPAIGGNSRGNSGTNHGIVIGSNANNIYIAGGKIGGNTNELAGTGTQGRGIQINGSAHDNIRIIGANVTGNQNSEGISQSISSGTGNSIQFNAGSTVAIDT